MPHWPGLTHMGIPEVDGTDSFVESPLTRKNDFLNVNQAAVIRLKEHRF